FGGDQARARAELEKLALYAGEGGQLEVEDIEALIGDVTQAALDRFSICTANGQGRDALRQLDRLSAAGQSPQGAMSALARHFERLHRVCAAVEAGNDLKTALGRIRPPLHFRQRDALEAQARRWSARQCARAIHLATRATERARLNPELERALAERLIITLASR
ncbi:MAG: DNA polymerase III subunit delta, partial [Alphaproteobacteria bacterium]